MKRRVAPLTTAAAVSAEQHKIIESPKPHEETTKNVEPKDELATKKRKVDDRELWKLAKGKFLLTTYLCHDDWNRLYNNQQKVKRLEGDRFAFGFEMCEECVWANCRATDLLAPMKKK